MINENDEIIGNYDSDLQPRSGSSLPSGGKSAEEIKQWYHKWMAEHDRTVLTTVNVLDMLKDFAASQQPVNDGWVRVEDALPESGKRVLCLCNTGLKRVGYFYKNQWEQDGPYSSFKEDGYTVTHWQRLPEPTKQTP